MSKIIKIENILDNWSPDKEGIREGDVVNIANQIFVAVYPKEVAYTDDDCTGCDMCEGDDCLLNMKYLNKEKYKNISCQKLMGYKVFLRGGI